MIDHRKDFGRVCRGIHEPRATYGQSRTQPGIGWIEGQDRWLGLPPTGRPGHRCSLSGPAKGEAIGGAEAYADPLPSRAGLAVAVLADPLQRLVYQKLGADRKRPPNALLVSNFLTPPVIERIERAAYQGRVGGLIRIVALDPIEVTAVAVTIRGPDGSRIESGDADREHGVWTYRATVDAPANTPLQIEVSARNRARAEATQTLVK